MIALVGAGDAAAVTLIGAEFDEAKHPRDEHGQWTDGSQLMAASPDTSTVEQHPGYAFFNREGDKWTRASDYEARQNAFDYATRDFPELGQQLREAYFGKPDSMLPDVVSLYRVGTMQDGVNSFFTGLKQAEVYQRRFGVERVQKVSFDPRRLVPSGTGAGEIWGSSDDVLRKEAVKALTFVGAAKGDPSAYRLSKFAREHAAEMVGAPQKVKDVIRSEVAKALRNGEGPAGIADRLFGEIDMTPEEIDRIARTEYVIARTGARLGKLDADGAAAKEWTLGSGEEGCPICQALDGQAVGIDEPFVLDGEEFDGPPAHPNCNCDVQEADAALLRAAIRFVGAEYDEARHPRAPLKTVKNLVGLQLVGV